MRSDELAKMDQAAATLADTFPPMLWRFYEASIKQGFSPPDALELTKCWLVGVRKDNS